MTERHRITAVTGITTISPDDSEDRRVEVPALAGTDVESNVPVTVTSTDLADSVVLDVRVERADGDVGGTRVVVARSDLLEAVRDIDPGGGSG